MWKSNVQPLDPFAPDDWSRVFIINHKFGLNMQKLGIFYQLLSGWSQCWNTRLNDGARLNVYNCYSFMYCRWYGFYLPILINTSKGKDLKFAFHCQEILLHCFDVCLPEMSSTHKSPHVLMAFNPSESIAAEVFRNISILCQEKKNPDTTIPDNNCWILRK